METCFKHLFFTAAKHYFIVSSRYRGGLDNCHNQTGESSVYTEFKGQEIMFHVSTLLPYDPGDRQQVVKKCVIGMTMFAISC